MTSSAARVLSEPGLDALIAVAHSQLQRGWHTAAQLAVYRDSVRCLDLRIGERAPGAAMDDAARMLWFSATKPLTAICVLMLAERGRIDLDRPIAEVWPEFAQGGKQNCTPRHVLTHRGGFPVFPHDFDWSRIGDWQAVTAATAAIAASWEPGTALGYHPVTYGFALGELIRRVDGRDPRTFMHDELFVPLHMDVSLGVDADRLRDVVPLRAMSEVTFDDPEGTERRTSAMVDRFNAPATLMAQIPAANAIGTADALARFYAMLERGGTLDGVRILGSRTVREAMSLQASTDADRTTGFPSVLGLGMFVGPGFAPFDQPGVFGHSGQQSSVGYADPERGLAVAYVTNGLQEPVVVALRHAEIAAAIIAACDP